MRESERGVPARGSGAPHRAVLIAALSREGRPARGAARAIARAWRAASQCARARNLRGPRSRRLGSLRDLDRTNNARWCARRPGPPAVCGASSVSTDRISYPSPCPVHRRTVLIPCPARPVGGCVSMASRPIRPELDRPTIW